MSWQTHSWTYTPRKPEFERYMSPNVHCSTIYNSKDTEAPYMSITGGMDKEDVVHIYSGILLSHKKEQNNAICSNMDGLRDYHTE